MQSTLLTSKPQSVDSKTHSSMKMTLSGHTMASPCNPMYVPRSTCMSRVKAHSAPVHEEIAALTHAARPYRLEACPALHGCIR
jgi:hypothetical protein